MANQAGLHSVGEQGQPQPGRGLLERGPCKHSLTPGIEQGTLARSTQSLGLSLPFREIIIGLDTHVGSWLRASVSPHPYLIRSGRKKIRQRSMCGQVGGVLCGCLSP